MVDSTSDGRIQKAHDQLVETVRKFEEASGVSVMVDWTRGRIGQAVRLLTGEWDSPAVALTALAKRATEIAKTCNAAVDELAKVLPAIKEDEDAA